MKKNCKCAVCHHCRKYHIVHGCRLCHCKGFL